MVQAPRAREKPERHLQEAQNRIADGQESTSDGWKFRRIARCGGRTDLPHFQDGQDLRRDQGDRLSWLADDLDERIAHDVFHKKCRRCPASPRCFAFICPETQGSYRGFAYDAIAISYYNDAVLRLLDNSAFEGNASNYVIYPDGRVRGDARRQFRKPRSKRK